MSLPELSTREHEVAAQECDAIAAYLERLVDLHDGPYAVQLARAHRTDAEAVRARAERHRRMAGE